MKRIFFALIAITLYSLSLSAQDGAQLEQVFNNGFVYRNLGPFRVSAWVSDIAVPETPTKAHLYTFYVASRNGGVWKTTNNGTTFTPVFEGKDVASIGALAIAPSNSDIVWVGTGDASCTRSAYPGNGIYKSVDGGANWQHMGLRDSQHIARVVIHPSNPDIVYVAVMGHLFSTNEERGVFKSSDGGATWKKVLYINEKTGAVDLVVDRNHPNTLFAATYECIRHPWRLEDGGSASGIYKTTDGGATWKKLGGGLPEGNIGRIGMDLYQKNPKILYTVVDNRNQSSEPSATPQPSGTASGPRLIGGEVYRTDDGGLTWRKMNSARDDVGRKTGYAFNQLRINPDNDERIFVTGGSIVSSEDSGKTWAGLAGPQGNRVFRRAFGDFRTLWIDSQNPDRMMAGSDGGVCTSYDGGRTCDHLANLPIGEVYALTVDMEQPYNVYAGLQDHESWKGPSNGWSGSVGLTDWVSVGVGDGMYNQVDPTDSRWVYNTQEFGRPGRYDQQTRTRKIIAPSRPAGQPLLRFNWVAPIRLSPHDPKTLYAGAQVLFRSRDRGDHWEEISPDLTTNDPGKISAPGAAIQHCTIVTISESPAAAGVIWVGTDDGKVQVTKNAGASWTDVTTNIAKAGGPEDAWVTRVFASNLNAAVAYVTKSKLRQDDFRPFVYKTTDYGATWTTIAGNLPNRSLNVIFEDYTNPNLLFVGSDAGVYVTIDGGAHWFALKGNLPIVPVTDLVIQPRESDLVVGTYGRAIWITNVAVLRELNETVLGEDVHFFSVQPRSRRQEGAVGNYRLLGDRHLVTPNEPNGLALIYYLKQAPKEKVTLTVAGPDGKTLRTLEGTNKVGLNRVVFQLGGFGFQQGVAGEFRPGLQGQQPREIPPGDYDVTLTVGDKKLTQKTRVLP
ncbi:MAG TPA: hypothetical protein VGQ39_19630 [Pyrinomonadaceae bacterium]|nr:hypothetical protein [Pyrinomonadaceae bacterium]